VRGLHTELLKHIPDASEEEMFHAYHRAWVKGQIPRLTCPTDSEALAILKDQIREARSSHDH
jgi:hypothetical protein